MTHVNSRSLRLLHVAPLAPPVTGIGVSFQHFIASSPLAAHANWVINSAGHPARSPGTKRPTPRRILRHVWLTARVMRAAREKRVDVVHLHGSSHDLSFIANGVSVAAARLVGAHTVWHLHEDLSVVLFPGRGALTRVTFASLMRAPSTLALLTEKDGVIARSFVPEHKLAIIPPTCSPEMLSIPLVRSCGSRSLRVLFVGWLSEAKGIFDLLRVAQLARDRIAGLEFWVVGIARSDNEARSVKAFIDQHNLHSVVKLGGLVTGAAKLRMFADAHLLFVPTHWDAFPVTVLEAMSAGLPVVGTHVGGLPLMLDGCGARLAPVGDVERMVEHLVELADHPERRVQMGAANRQRFVDHYHPDHVGQLAVELYRRLATK